MPSLVPPSRFPFGSASPPRPCGREGFSTWLAQPLGQALLAAEQELLAEVLGEFYGYHLLQLGSLGEADLLGAARIGHRIVLDPQGPAGQGRTGLVARPEALPIASETVGVALLPHTLEFAEAPHEVLREVSRVLIPEGHVVVLGFDPWSPWGMRRWLGRRSGAPWCGRFYGANRLRDWLSLLGFTVLTVRPFYHRPPFTACIGLTALERLGRRLPWLPGASYLMVARKRVIPLSPIKPRWRARRGLAVEGLAEPTPRHSRSSGARP